MDMDTRGEYLFVKGLPNMYYLWIVFVFGQGICLTKVLSETTETTLQEGLVNVNMTNSTVDSAEPLQEFDYTK